MNAAQKIKEKAEALGFELFGVTRATPVPDHDFFVWWLNQGFAGTMAYLKRGEERRGNPEIILPGVRSIICCGLNYYSGKSPQPPLEKGGRGGNSVYAHGGGFPPPFLGRPQSP